MANFKWRDNHMPKFLELYHREESIWNIRSESYKNTTIRGQCYENIRSGMEIEGLTINDIKTKIKSIRTTYKTELTKLLKANKSGTGTEDVYAPKLFWFAQADAFLRGVSIARESTSNLNIVNTQPTDVGNPRFPERNEAEELENVVETANLQESQGTHSHGDIFTASTSKGKAKPTEKYGASNTSVTTQAPSKGNKRKRDYSIEDAVNKLQAISNECKETDDEFDFFCKSLACQLRKMPLQRALQCQEKLQSVMTQERLQQLISDQNVDNSAYQNSSWSQHNYSEAPSPYPNSSSPSQYSHDGDILTQAFANI